MGNCMLVLAAAPEELGDLPGQVVGVGPIVAAVRAALLIERLKPSAVCLIGTAGSYKGGPPIGQAVVAQRLGLSASVAVMGLGYVPRPPAPVDADEGLMARLPGILRANVLTVQAITTDPTLSERLSDGWSVEHLEAYSVAYACREAGVPFVAVLGIANAVGRDAHVQWLLNRDAAQDAARKAILPLLG